MDARLAPASIACLMSLPTHAAEPLAAIQKFHQYTSTFAISGQPRRGQFAAIAAAGFKVVINVASAESNPDAVAYLYRTAFGRATEPEEMATMTRLWRLNKGYEYENSPQWPFLLDDVSRSGLPWAVGNVQ